MTDDLLDGFDESAEALEAERGQRLRAASLTIPVASPDEAARANKLADKRGMPFGVVAGNLSDFEERDRLDGLDAIGRDHPIVGQFLSDPRRMALAHDDAENLANLSAALQSAPGMIGSTAQMAVPAIAGLRRAKLWDSFSIGSTSALTSAYHTATDVLDQTTQAPTRLLFENIANLADKQGDPKAAEILRSAFADPLGFQGQADESLAVSKEITADQTQMADAIGGRPTLDQVRGNPQAAAEQFFAYYGNQGTQSLPAMLLAIATRNPEVGGAVMGGQTGTDTYTRLRGVGVPRLRAAGAAVGTGAVETALGTVGLAAATKPVASALLTGPLVEAGTEAATAIAQTNIEDLAQGRKTPIVDQLLQTLDAAVLGFGFGAVEKGGSATIDALAGNHGRQADMAVQEGNRVLQSVRGNGQLSAITTAAANLKLGERSPADAEAFVREAGGGSVYLKAEDAITLFQSEPAMLADLVGGDDILQEQMAGGDVVIPLEKWASVVARLPNADEIVRHGRMSADDLSAAELEAFDPDEVLAGLGYMPGTADAAARAEPGQPDAKQAIADDVLGQLTATNRFTPAAADAQAKLWGAAFARFGAVSGQDPMALYQRYMGGIDNGTSPLSTRRWNGPGQLDALLESIRAGEQASPTLANGASLASWLAGKGGIQDEGGELRGMDAATTRPGLVNTQGLALDRAREAAVEAGFLPEDASLNDFLEALDTDLRGTPVYSDQFADKDRKAFEIERDRLQQAIDETPALRDLPADQFNALTNQQIADTLFGDSTLDQPAFHGTPHAVDRFSMQKIGTGEGNQAFGWGIYFASQRGLAEYYRRTLTQDRAEFDGALTEAREDLRARLKREDYLGFDTFGESVSALRSEPDVWDLQDRDGVMAALNRYDQRSKDLRGSVYQVEVPEDSDLIDYDTPLSGQPEKVRAAIAANPDLAEAFAGTGLVRDEATGDFAESEKTGGQAYQALAEKLGQQGASHAFFEAGIPGLRYLDGVSRTAGDGSHNYVIWDESAISEPTTLYQSGPPPSGNIAAQEAPPTSGVSAFRGMTREQFLGNPTITSARNASDLKPKALTTVVGADPVPFLDGLTARFSEDGAAVYDGDTVIASYNFGDTLVVDKNRRRQGIAEELVYQWRTRYPAPAKTRTRTKASQAVQEKVWDRIQRELTRTLFQPALSVDGRGTQTIEHNGGQFVQRGAQWYLADENGEPQDFGTLGAATQVADGLGGEVLADTPNEGGAPTWSVVLPAVAAREALASRTLYQEPAADGKRGQIKISPDRSMRISLFEQADRSTFLHESGHFFLEVFRDLATADNASEQAQTDYAALLNWFGTDTIGTDQHEQFARGFEQYLGEGRAPSPELQSVFSQFKAWVLSIYKTLRNLNVELSDDVRQVFDRMLASEEEIEAAQVRQGFEPLARTAAQASAIGLTDKQLADYQAMLAEATEEARAEVMAKLYKAHEREHQAWWREEEAKVREEVQAEYESKPVVRALRVLSGRKMVDGAEVPEALRGLKLDKAALVAQYGEPYLKRLGKTYAKSGGAHPDQVAMLFGLPSGDALVTQLANVQDTLARVDAEVASRMRERHGDPMTDGTLAETAMDAVHNSKRVQALQFELDLLAKLAGQPKSDRRVLKATAKRLIDGKTNRALRPNDYLAAERRAAREATKAAAKGDYAAALQAKRQQAFNVAMYAEARAAQTEFEKHGRYLRRFTAGDARAKLGKAGASYLDQVDNLLEGLEMKQVSGTQVERRARLAEWVRQQEADGNTVNIPQKVLDESGLTNVRDMVLGDLRDVVDTIKQIDHLATLKTKLMLGAELRDRIEVDADMAASVVESLDRVPERTGDKTWRDTATQRLADVDVGRLLPSNIARELDGYRDGGAVWSNTIKVIRDAVYGKVNPAMKVMQETVAGLYHKHYNKAEMRNLDAPVFRPGLDDVWSKGRILSLAMNWGSDGNREAILTQARSRISEAQAVELLQTLDARDWAFVQDMVDQVNSYWPEIAETQRRRTGLVPEKVEGKPFVITTADGQQVAVKGGYFPLKYDSERSGYGATREEIDDIYDALRIGKTAKAATRNGHTIERVGSGGKTVNLGLDIAQAHMRDVIRDIHLGDAVAYVHNTLHGLQFTEAVISAGKREHLKALDLWIKDVAAGEMGARSGIEAVMRFTRQNMTAAVLAWKVTTSALQFTGLIQTASVIGRRATLRGMARLMGKSWVGPHSIWADIRAKSQYMDERFGAVPDAVQVVADARAGKLKAGHAAMVRWGYVPMARMQMIADAATWLAAEAQGLKKFSGDVAKARSYADDIVIRAQSPENFIDKPAVSRGTISENIRQTELVKATTMLLSYMMAKGNVAREKFQGTSFKNPADVAKFGIDMVQLFALETIIMGLLKGGLPDEDDDEDGDGVLDEWLAYIGKEVGLGFLGTIPLVSQAATEGRGYTAQGVMERAWSTADNATGQIFANEWDSEALQKKQKAVVTLAGITTGLPSSQINTTADALWRVHDGEDVSPMDYLIRPEQ